MPDTRPILLLVEDDESVARVISVALEQRFFFLIDLATKLSQALEMLRRKHYHAVVCDLNLPDSVGKETVQRLQREAPTVPIIVVTGGSTACGYTEAIRLGAQDYLEKGHFTHQELERCIRHAIERHKVRSMFQPIEKDLYKATQAVEKLEAMHKGEF